MANYFALHIGLILFAGFVAGWICKRLKTSVLIGYLVAGMLIGPGGLDLLGTREAKMALEMARASVKTEHPTLVQVRAEKEKAAAEEEGEIEFDPNGEENGAGGGGDNNPDNTADADVSPTAANPDATQPANPDAAKPDETQSDAPQSGETAANAARPDAPNNGVSNTVETDIETLVAFHNDAFMFETTTEFGVLLLLFAIGIEFTFDKLTSTAKYMFVGGTLQMAITIAVTAVVCKIFGSTWTQGVIVGCVTALSSTALVYKSMQDVDQAETKRGQATLGLLLFQDVALVPLLLLLPRLYETGDVDASSYILTNPWIDMTVKTATFCAVVVLAKFANARFIVPRLAAARSNELVILFAVLVLASMCVVAGALGLTPALGALAGGLTLGENRLTRQIDALVMPFRETFSAMFFISLGMLMDFGYVVDHPIACFSALFCAISIKWLCGALALRLCGMDWSGARSFGLCISQVGELAFMILGAAYAANAISEGAYQQVLFLSVASLVLTPNMVKFALTKLGMQPETKVAAKSDSAVSPELLAAINSKSGHAIVVGGGLIGGRLTDELTSLGKSVCLVDFNPVNLHPFAQRGIATVAGDGASEEVLRAAGIGRAEIVLVTVPKDELSLNVVRACRRINPTCVVLARARYSLNVQPMKLSGAEMVLCEENAVCDSLLRLIAEYYAGRSNVANEKESGGNGGDGTDGGPQNAVAGA